VEPEEALDAKIEQLARKQHGAIARRQVLALGGGSSVITRRVKARRWTRVAPGVYVLRGIERTFKQRVMIAVLQAGRGAAASHRCAAVLHVLDGVRMAAVEVTITRRTTLRLPAGVVLHRSTDLEPRDIVEIDGIPTTSITRTLVDIANRISLADLECAYEDGVRRHATSFDAVESLVDRVARPGRPGVRGARVLLRIAVRDGKRNGSELETRFFQLIRALGLPLPVRQRQVCRPDGRFAYADYAYEAQRVLFELQGYDGHTKRIDHRRDTERNNMLNLRGYRVYEFTWHHVMREPERVKEVVIAALGIQAIEYRS
jgi:very-short-patch-repair endonuclease